MEKELTIKLIKMENGFTFRLVVWEDSQVIEIFESDDFRNLLNRHLEMMQQHGFTEEKFKVRK